MILTYLKRDALRRSMLSSGFMDNNRRKSQEKKNGSLGRRAARGNECYASYSTGRTSRGLAGWRNRLPIDYVVGVTWVLQITD